MLLVSGHFSLLRQLDQNIAVPCLSRLPGEPFGPFMVPGLLSPPGQFSQRTGASGIGGQLRQSLSLLRVARLLLYSGQLDCGAVVGHGCGLPSKGLNRVVISRHFQQSCYVGQGLAGAEVGEGPENLLRSLVTPCHLSPVRECGQDTGCPPWAAWRANFSARPYSPARSHHGQHAA